MKIDINEFSDSSYFIKEIEVDPSWVDDFGPDYHSYRSRWEKASRDLYLYDFPLCLEVETSYACNLECPQCPRFSSIVPKNGNMSFETFSKVIQECEENQMESIFLDHGGEPLLNKRLPEFVKLCRDANIIDIMISTNATLLTREISRSLIRNGLTKINFSIDAATPETYSIVRKGGNYHQVVKNIEVFLDEKKRHGKSYPRVRISFIVQEENKNEMETFYDQWKDHANIICFQKAKNYNVILQQELDAGNENRYDFRCYQVFTNMMVDYKGGIHICSHDYNHKHILGGILKNTIKECWESSSMRQFRDIHRKGEWSSINFCKNCVQGSW